MAILSIDSLMLLFPVPGNICKDIFILDLKLKAYVLQNPRGNHLLGTPTCIPIKQQAGPMFKALL